MERFFRNLRVFGAVMCVLFLLITVSIGGLYLFRDRLPFAIPVSVQPQEQQPDEPLPSAEEEITAEPAEEPEDPPGESNASFPEESAVDSSVGEPVDTVGNDSSSAPEPPQAAAINRPNPMRAVYLQPGVDYPVAGSEEVIRSGIDAALGEAQALGMNTVIALPQGEEGAVYQTSQVRSVNQETDIFGLLVDEARAQGFAVYALYSAAVYPTDNRLLLQSVLDMDIIDFAYRNAQEFAGRYSLDGLLIDHYYNEPSAYSYALYIRSSAGIGYLPYMRSLSEALCSAVLEAFRLQSPATQVGLVVDGVWENAPGNPEGSNTSQNFTALGSGNADTKKMVEDRNFDFIAMRPGGSTDSTAEPFQEVLRWWNDQAANAGLPLYILHLSDRICTDAPGYQSPDELVQQVIYARDCAQYEGSIFNSLPRLKENPQSSTDLLVRLFENKVNINHVLTELAVSTPEQTAFSTFEPVMVFRGASDPNFKVMLGGQPLDTDTDGYFTTTVDLEPGENLFTFEHKEKTLSYRITRNVQIIQEVSPTGMVEVEGGMRLQITALAHNDATVSATLGGRTVALTRGSDIDDDTNENSSYSKFIGEFTLPAATASAQSLGTLTVQGEWQGISDSMQGASVTINPIVAAGDGDLIIVTADSAKTFPVDTLNNESDPAYFPLPKGTMDYAIGDVLSFKNSSGSYQYYQLQSGLRVYAQDVSKTDGQLSAGNAIRGMNIRSDEGYTYIRLATDQPVPYLVTYRNDSIAFDFQYTASTPASLEVPDNPVIRSADWSGSRLTLSFTQAGSFLGYYAYYEGDTLVLRLTNPPVRLRNVRVAIDPGHGGKDRGASGYYPDMDEKDVNLAIAQETAEALEALGMQVKLIQTDPYLTLTQRIEEARAFQADIFLSIHSNSSVDAGASGTEAFYFYPNSQPLASAISRRVASALDTANRGGKQARYVVTTDSRFASALIECGFISNKNEYRKLTDPSYQREVASGIAEGVRAYIDTISTSITGGQGEELGDRWEDQENSGEGDQLLHLRQTSLSLSVGESFQLQADQTGNAAGEEVFWESDDETVAVVDEEGYVEAVGEGSCIITASIRSGASAATCTLEVLAEKEGSQKISFSETAFTLQLGEGFRIKPETGPKPDKLRFESKDETVVTVDSDGWVEAVGEGETVIHVWEEGADEEHRLAVTVQAPSE